MHSPLNRFLWRHPAGSVPSYDPVVSPTRLTLQNEMLLPEVLDSSAVRLAVFDDVPVALRFAVFVGGVKKQKMFYAAVHYRSNTLWKGVGFKLRGLGDARLAAEPVASSWKRKK